MEKGFVKIDLGLRICRATGAFAALAAAMLLGFGGRARAAVAEPGTVYNSPHVTFSPDGLAWTTDQGKTGTWYEHGERVYTGIPSGLSPLREGEHYYLADREGTVPIGYWQVEHRHGTCIHNAYPGDERDGLWHGVPVEKHTCEGYYYSGWVAYCADCGERMTHLIYMSREAARSIDYLDMGEVNGRQLAYYYCCPHCDNFEQGFGLRHDCKGISKNRYWVEYRANAPGDWNGYMENSVHMYDNAGEYEGNPVTPATRLTLNAYSRRGYEFAEWNTEPDGSGISFCDGAEILNLTREENGRVVLYAVWRPSVSYLRIDPGEGRYNGLQGISTVTGSYGSMYFVDGSRVTAPAGHRISFETNGGNPIGPMDGTQHFTEWMRVQPFYGRFADQMYCFAASNGNTDTLLAGYQPDPVILPTPVKAGSSFGGWYFDPEFTDPAGAGGDSITPGTDMTLYAQWADLTLWGKDNYRVGGGRGAVDLSWFQPDGLDKAYLLYQSRDGRNWTQIYAAEDIGGGSGVEVSFDYSGEICTYTVPATGFYTLAGAGAQGGDYALREGIMAGGPGGRVSVEVWLQEGEVLTCNIGGRNGYNKGGGFDPAVGAVGGGCTVVSSNLKGTIFIAGGGGGATGCEDGGPGGSAANVTAGESLLGTAGESGGAGGGGGYAGGRAGAVIPAVTGKRVIPVEFSPGSHVRVSFASHECNPYYNDGQDHLWARWRYRICQDTGLVAAENDVWTEEDLVYIEGKPYFVIDADASIWLDSHYGNLDSYRALYCGDVPGSFGMYAAGVSDCYHGVESEEHANGHYRLGTVTDVVLQEAYSRPSFGGSNYVNADCARTYVSESGQCYGNGFVSVCSRQVGFSVAQSLEGVLAADQAAPDAVGPEGVRKEALGGNRVCVSWDAPRDNGTLYYHLAQSYLAGGGIPLCRSNVTANTLTSGVRGYYILADGNADTKVTQGNGSYSEAARWTGELARNNVYLHVAAVDRAGNLGEAAHIPLTLSDRELRWPLHTGPLEIEGGSNVYTAKDGKIYVRSDGATPFTLGYRAYMEGRARDDYQINYVVFETGTGGDRVRNILHCASRPVREEDFRISPGDLNLSATGESLLSFYPRTSAFRGAAGGSVEVAQDFVLDEAADGVVVEILPVAGADYRSGKVYSDYAEDQRNGLTVTGDGTAPEIYGLEALKSLDLIDRNEGSVELVCTAEDSLSGVGEFYLTVYNSDNAVQKTYVPGADGKVRVDITRDEPVFSGDFMVTAYAADHVGNERRVSAGTTEFGICCDISRILEPHSPIFQCGESGVLTITTWGYADRVEVEFPKELLELDSDLNRVYVYTDLPAYRHEEKLQFMIPLYAPENAGYVITVRAYKGDKRLEEHPSLSVIGVSGTVLDDVRTRLR